MDGCEAEWPEAEHAEGSGSDVEADQGQETQVATQQSAPKRRNSSLRRIR